MNWAQFKYPTFHMCPAGAVVASWTLTQNAGSSPFTVMTNIFVTKFAEFSETLKKTQMGRHETETQEVQFFFLVVIHYR